MLTAHFRLKTSIYYVRYLRVIPKNIIKLYLKIIIGFIITSIFLNLHFYLSCQKLNESRPSEIYFRYARLVQWFKNKSNINRLKGENDMILLTEEQKYLTKSNIYL